MTNIHHALVLNLHQPPNNLEHLFAKNEWEAKEILFAYDRIARSLWGYEDVGRVHVSHSGTLLESLSSREFQEKTYRIATLALAKPQYHRNFRHWILPSGVPVDSSGRLG